MKAAIMLHVPDEGFSSRPSGSRPDAYSARGTIPMRFGPVNLIASLFFGFRHSGIQEEKQDKTRRHKRLLLGLRPTLRRRAIR